MKVLIIPDVHLKPWIFEKALDVMKSGSAEKAVCLMDLADNWGHEKDVQLYIDTYDAAIQFAKDCPDTLWCWGNHDLSYYGAFNCSGHSRAAHETVVEKIKDLLKTLPDPKQIAYIHRIDNVLFLHGGLSELFVLMNLRANEKTDIDVTIDTINNFPEWKVWNDRSPVWCRPQWGCSMFRPDEFLQVVGHTPVEEITRKDNVVSCDVFSTYRDGKPIGSQKLSIIDTISWEFWYA